MNRRFLIFFRGAIFKFGFASLSPHGHTDAASHTTCHQARQPSSDGCEPLCLEYSKIRAPGSCTCVCCTRAHVTRSRDASSQYGLLHGQARRTLQTAGGGATYNIRTRTYIHDRLSTYRIHLINGCISFHNCQIFVPLRNGFYSFRAQTA